MVMSFDILAPVDGHLPLMLGCTLRADQKVCGFNCGFEVRLLEKRAYTGHDFADEEVALGRSFVAWGDRNLENRYHNGVLVRIQINGERVKGGVIGRDKSVIFVVVKGHITEPMGEVDSRESPCAGAYWYEK